MEREIKFKGKRVDKEEFAFGDLLTGMGYKKGKFFILPHLSYYPSDCKSVDGYEVIPETIGQYTGLKDKNGKEIYEGDVVRVGIVPFNYIGKNPEPYYVDAVCVYSPGSFLYKRISPFDKKKLSRNWTYRPVYRHDIYTVEIIGNITDNEDLLKDGRD